MTPKTFSLTTGVIFSLIASAHVLRLIFRWNVTVDGGTIPTWVSWLALLIAAYLAFEGFRLSKKA